MYQVVYFQSSPRLWFHEARHILVESIVRQTLGVKRHMVKRVFEEGGGLIVELDVRDRLAARDWRHVPLWGIPATLRYAPARVRCGFCGRILVEEIPWSQGKCRLSQGLMWLLSSWFKLLPWEQVGNLFGVHWNMVATAVRQAVSYGLARRDLDGVVYIGMDEISRRSR